MKKVKNKKIEKDSFIKKVLKWLKEFFNKPAPIIIFLIVLNCFLILCMTRYTKNDLILIGEINTNDLAVNRIHCFTNGDMDYFYAEPAYYADDTKVYSYQIGYYVENANGDLIEFVTRSKTLDKASSIGDIVYEQSAWEFEEASSVRYFFTDDVINNIDRMYFVIKASTSKDSKKADVYVKEAVDTQKLTK